MPMQLVIRANTPDEVRLECVAFLRHQAMLAWEQRNLTKQENYRKIMQHRWKVLHEAANHLSMAVVEPHQ